MSPAPEAPLRLLLLDDDAAHRDELVAHLAADPRFAVVAARGLSEGLPLGPSDLDLIVVDPTRAGHFDFHYLRLLRGQVLRARLVVRTATFEAVALLDLLALGVSGVLVKRTPPTAALRDGLALLARADAVLLARAMVEALRSEWYADRLLGPQLALPTLDAQERTVLRWLVAGASAKEIAGETGISLRHVQRLSAKLQDRFGVRSLCQLGAVATRYGLC
jgi:DNA-binding NarL/FixJ family response regulator